MANLEPLIRVRRHSVEQKQKFLADLYRKADELVGQKDATLQALHDERSKMDQNSSVDMLMYFNSYSEAMKARVLEINDLMAKLDARIEIAREDMREAFADLKKIEITQERREEEELAAIEKVQSELLDEVALEGFRRKMAEVF